MTRRRRVRVAKTANWWRASILVLLALAAINGCRAFRPALESAARDRAGVVDNLGYLQAEVTVEANGTLQHGVFVADHIEIREPDDEVEFKGNLEALDLDISTDSLSGRGSVGGVSFRLVDRTRFAAADGTFFERDMIVPSFVPGAFVKVECVVAGRTLEARKLQLRTRGADETDEIQGEVESVDFQDTELRIGGVPVRFDTDTVVTWGLDEDPDRDPRDALRSALRAERPGLPRVRNIDDENRRPAEQWRLGESVTIGGELQLDFELRENHDLKHRTDRDELTYGTRAKLEAAFELDEQIYAFIQGRVRREFVHFDQDRDRDFDTEYRLGETFVYAEDWIAPGLALQFGRQDFDHGREWVMDELLDAARLYVNLDRWLLEASASMITFGAGRRQEGVKNFLLGLHGAPIEDSELFAYALHRHGGTDVDLERTHVGVSLEGEWKPFEYWGDVGYARGTEDDTRIEGYGFDVAAMYAPRRVPMRPSVYAGFALGSGDSNPDRGVDRNFRQTGLHDNNDKFNGVTSFRYLGELVRPALSNLQIVTVGAGFRPSRKTSLDLVFHTYRQLQAAPLFSESRLRQQPTGESADIGQEIDLIFGWEDLFPLEVELIGAFFRPGRAFEIDDVAWFAGGQIELNF